jgi:hypothetical protein
MSSDGPPVIPRLLAGVCVLLIAACLGGAPRDAGARVRDHVAHVAAAPTQLDYLVFASMADATRPLMMATYRPARFEASEVAVQLH